MGSKFSRASTLGSERLFPHKVDPPVPDGGLGKQLNDMFEWCSENVAVGTWEQHGVTDWTRRDDRGFPSDSARFYFMGEASARAFRRAWLPGSDESPEAR